MEATQGGRCNFLALGDMNATVQELETTPWASALNAEFMVPSQPTCSSGKLGGRAIDMMLVSKAVKPLVGSLEVDWMVPFAPHAALRVCLKRHVREMLIRVPVVARRLPSRGGEWADGARVAGLLAG